MHSIHQSEVNCVHCGSENLKKIFKTLSVVKQNRSNSTGDVVKEYIENSKEDLKRHRRELKEREYK